MAYALFMAFLIGVLSAMILSFLWSGSDRHCLQWAPSTGKCTEYKTTDELVKEARDA